MKRVLFIAAVLAVALLASCASPPAPLGQAAPAAVEEKPFALTILHVGDTHSKMEPTLVRLTLDIDDSLKGKGVYVELGGFPNVMSAEETLRRQAPNPLFLHSGDLFQGTLYFTQYLGAADTDFWNLMKLDVATLGNHEFDKGPAILLNNLLKRATFTIVSANVDIQAEPELQGVKIQPYTVRKLGGEEVGVIGLSTVETPYISSPGKNIVFLDAVISVQRAVSELASRGIDKIILLSHQGYSEDLTLAPQVSGIDVIVGGHSHTLLGDFARIGLASAGPYPTQARGQDGGMVLVVAANEWGKILGDLEVTFDPKGAIQSWRPAPRAVTGKRFFRVYDVPDLGGEVKRVQFSRDAAGAVSIAEYDGKSYAPVASAEQGAAYRGVYDALLKRLAREPLVLLVDPDPQGAAKLAEYAAGVNQLKAQGIAQAGEDLVRRLNSGAGPIIADGMAWKTGAQIAINNPGGVRININQGPISVATVYEDGADFQVARYGTDPDNPYVYVSGLRFTLDAAKPKGQRIRNVRVKTGPGTYAPIDPQSVYKVVVNNFMAAGGDRYDTLKEAAGKYDTGFNDAEVFMEYIKDKVLVNLDEERIELRK
jgi:5'-nucleotidase/UDP-sugar diphosphatase